MSLNVDESYFIVFKTVKELDLEVNVSHVKFMGTVIDDKLSWKPHMYKCMYKLKAYVTQKVMWIVSLPSSSIFNFL